MNVHNLAAYSLHPWYALRVKSNYERAAAASLAGRGLDPFVATYRVRRNHAGGTKESELPLFPGYVFCRFNALDRLPVLTVPGVVNVVSFNGQAAALDEAEIAALQTLVNSDVGITPWLFLAAGRKVRIQTGPLKDLEGVVLEVKNRFRIVVSVTLLQRSVSAEIEREWVCPIHDPSISRNAPKRAPSSETWTRIRELA